MCEGDGMEEWKECKLKGICDYGKDRTEVSSLDNSNYISTENMLPNRAGITTATALPTGELTPSFEADDTLVSNIRPYFKKNWKATFSGGCSADVPVFKAKENISKEYLYYVLADDEFFKYSMATSKGTKMPRGDKTSIMNYPVKLPPLPTQQKIARILSSLDDKIELNNKINTNLEQQAGVLFKNWFVDDSEKFHTIGDYIVPKRGKNLLSKDAIHGEVPVVAGGLEPATYHNTANTKPPVLTISASGANAGFVNLWNIPVWSSDSSYIDSGMTNDVYFWYILLKLRQKEIFDSQTGSAQPHIYPQHISVMPISELDFDKVSKFIKQVTPFFEQIGANQQENLRLIALRDTLLPKLMNGEIETNHMGD